MQSVVGDVLAAQAEADLLSRRSLQSWETSGDAFVSFDADDRITAWNSQAEKLFGWPAEEALSRRFNELLIPPQYRGAYVTAQRGFLAEGASSFVGRHAEIVALHRDGRPLPIDLMIWTGHDGGGPTFHALAVDATRRGVSVCCSGAIVESSDTAIVGHACDGTILTWNRAAEETFGFTAAEAIGQPFWLVVPPELRQQHADWFNGVLGGESLANQETQGLRKDGSGLDVSLTVSAIYDPAGGLVGFSTLTRDVTEQRRIAAALAAAQHDLEIALDEARRSEARTRTFLADAAHQLRTPIAAIRACVETLLRGAPVAERDRLLADTVREASRAARLLTSLLHMARLDQGETLTPRRCDVIALCLEEAERARYLARNLDISVRVAELLDDRPLLEPNAVREILGNLLDNARRYANDKVEVVVRSTVHDVEIWVSDDGPGLPRDLASRAFERFVTLDDKGGSGLGLPIARGLAEAHGGTLVYDRPRGFVLVLPNGPASSPAPAISPA